MTDSVRIPNPSVPSRIDIDVGAAKVPVDAVQLDAVLDWAIRSRRSSCWKVVVTPNLHHLRMVREAPDLAQRYSDAALSLADGWPVAWLASRASGIRVRRVAGSDLFEAIIGSRVDGVPLVLVGGTPGVPMSSLEDSCRQRGWRVTRELAPRDELVDDCRRAELLTRIARAGDQGVIVFGVGTPRQEQLAVELAAESGGGVALCLGMSINFSAGVVRRAPYLVQAIGFEWLFRALTEPRRLLLRYVGDLRALCFFIRRNPRSKSHCHFTKASDSTFRGSD